MIYIDTSVVLAELLAEGRRPPEGLWAETLVASRLVEFELWTRVHAMGVGDSHGEAARDLLGRISFLELAPPVLARALEPFPAPARTLDALHLASADFLRARGQSVEVATYDRRMRTLAEALGFRLAEV